MKAVQNDIGRQPLQPLGNAFDLRDAGQESQHAPCLVGQREAASGGDRILDPLRAVAAQVPVGQRMRATGAFDDGCPPHQGGEPRAVERCRHRDKAQVGPQRRLRV